MQANNIGSDCRTCKVLRFPALFKTGYKPLKVWAEGGLVWFEDENKERTNWLSPIEALERLVTLVTDYRPSMLELPHQFQIDKSVLLRFVDDFKENVYEEALKQQYGNYYSK
jgi:hypothetical protein